LGGGVDVSPRLAGTVVRDRKRLVFAKRERERSTTTKKRKGRQKRPKIKKKKKRETETKFRELRKNQQGGG